MSSILLSTDLTQFGSKLYCVRSVACHGIEEKPEVFEF